MKLQWKAEYTQRCIQKVHEKMELKDKFISVQEKHPDIQAVFS